MTGTNKPMRVIDYNLLDVHQRAELFARGTEAIFDEGLKESIAVIIDDVRTNGDAAVSRALKEFDGCDVSPDNLRISDAEFDAAQATVSKAVREAITVGIENIRAFNEHLTREREWRIELQPGLVVGEKSTPVASAGLFVPSGKGSFPSVLVQLGTPAVVAGVPDVAVIVPPVPGGNGEVDPAVLCVARELELDNVFRVNGPAGVAALAFGTETIPQVRKVVGPGSPPVAAAQVACQAFGCQTQMILGPSESMVIADDSADVRLLAADLLNEAEHGPDSASLLVTESAELIEQVQLEISKQLAELPEPRRSYASAALGPNGGAVLVKDMAQAVEVGNLYAPEHMQIVARDEEAVLAGIVHAGEVLLGQSTPFSLANYVLGVPASLPTGGFARVNGGITAETFLKKISIGKASPEALAALAPGVIALAEHEDFPAHAAAVRARQEQTVTSNSENQTTPGKQG